MSSVNKAIFLGRVVAAPESKNVGQALVVNFRLALNESYNDKEGKRVEKTEYVQITAWNKLAEICNKFLTQGREVYIEAKVQTDSYEKGGEKRYSTKFVANAIQLIGQRDAEDKSPPTVKDDDGFNF